MLNTDDIIRMAREVGIAVTSEKDWRLPFLERFAEFAAEVEREHCARVCEAQYPYSVMHTDQRAATNCAAAIRARGNK